MFSVFFENACDELARFKETEQQLRSREAKLMPWAAVAIGDEQAVMQMNSQGRLKDEVCFHRSGLFAFAAWFNHIDW